VKFGICSQPAQAATMQEIGADFVEWNVSSNVGTASDEAYRELQALAASLAVKPEAWNVLLPGEIKVTGPDADLDQLQEYAKRALPRVRQLGGEVIVFGSGRSRSIPEGFPEDTGRAQFRDACAVVASVAAANDLTIVFEPLRKPETNLINLVSEGLDLVESLNQPGFELLADMYHMAEEAEPFDIVVKAAPRLKHVHIAAAGSRGVPLNETDQAMLAEFFRELHRAGYDQRISFECRAEDVEEYRQGLAIARQLWAETAA
jgi:sugar phosphate isomerase/epimerase